MVTFTSIEWIAFLFCLIGAIKIVSVLISPKSWFNGVSKKVYGSKNVSTVVFLILAAVVFYYLIQSFTIVQIIAVSSFMFLFQAIGFAQFGKEFIELGNKIVNKRLSFVMILYSLVWLALMLWALYQLFIS